MQKYCFSTLYKNKQYITISHIIHILHYGNKKKNGGGVLNFNINN